MSKNKKAILFLSAIAVTVAVSFLAVKNMPRDNSSNEITSVAKYDFKAFSVPEYINLDAEDTYFGLVDVTGQWVNTYTPTDTVEFSSDGTYTSTRLAASGRYKVQNGYVALISSADTRDALRMVKGDGVDVFLQIDDDVMPYVYRRVTLGEELDELEPMDADAEERMRHYLSSIQQILQKSHWESDTAGVDEITIDATAIHLYKGSILVASWPYKVQMPEDRNAIPLMPPYELPVDVNGERYTLLLDAGDHPEYSTGFHLSVYTEDNTLIRAITTETVVIEEP